MNIIVVIRDCDVFTIKDSMGVGISKTISISNTIKIIANMKNRNENGTRALFFGSKPHSNGDVFSRSDSVRLFSVLARINKSAEINIAMIDVISGVYITWIYTKWIISQLPLVFQILDYYNCRSICWFTWKYINFLLIKSQTLLQAPQA